MDSSLHNDDYYADLQQLLEDAYLQADNPRSQSGFSGDDARWERGRRVIAQAINHDGTFLDIGCASGYLMETITSWAAEDGYTIEPYGLDLSPRLADLARSRLPHWTGRIYTGNAIDWTPPGRFDYVRTELVYVPEKERPGYVQRLLDDLVAPGGRLIVCAYGSSRPGQPRAEPAGDLLSEWGFDVHGQADSADLNGVVITRVAWIERQQPSLP